MKTVRGLDGMRSERRSVTAGATVGFVPTMGALHEGHASLMERACRECDVVVASIFVNPKQFGPGEDYQEYPRDEATDAEMAARAGVDVLWLPAASEMYPPGFETRVEVPALAQPLCGRSRPQHFGGVAVVVLKLFHVVDPARAYFGRKDYQQLAIVSRMARDLDLAVEIVPCPIVRATDGLALSSRNRKLTTRGRKVAPVLWRALRTAQDSFTAGEGQPAAIVQAAACVIAAEPTVSLEYLELVDPRTLDPAHAARADSVLAVAARIDGVRLIDNVVLGDTESAPS